MSEVRLVVREANRDWSGTIHGSSADRAIAALSADPVTLDELEVAVGRFAKHNPESRYFSNLRPGICDEPYDAGLVVIDLVARLVVADSTYSSPSRTGTVTYHNGRCATDTSLQFHLADDWKFSSDGLCWEGLADSLRRKQAAKPVRDNRQVFYGRPLLEFIGRECFAAFARREEIAKAVRSEWAEHARKRLAEDEGVSPDQIDASRLTEEVITPKTWEGEKVYTHLYYDTISEIHAAWLLTPGDDLGGLCPREIALDGQKRLDWDMQDRCNQWSFLGQCPPGLPESSHAYQFAPFGTHELVMYYEMVRSLLWSCWAQLTEMAESPRGAQLFEALTVGDFLTTEVARLEAVREAWLDAPDGESHGRTPRSMIHRERARLPEAMSGHEAMVDPDCPCCQMMADMPGPMFWHLDGCNMDNEFAFDIYHQTREEWDAEQRRWEEHNRKFDAERAECKRLGVADSSPREDGTNAVWSRSFAVGDTADVPLGIRVFGVGCRLAELIVGLRGDADREATPPEVQRHIDQLNRDFGNLREVLQSTESSLAASLVEPVASRFAETLGAVAAAHPDLAEQCDSLRGELEELLSPPPPESDWVYDPNDPDDVPF